MEKLYVHGFPRDTVVSGISNESLYKLAGNTVTVPLCGFIWGAMFGFLDFSRPHGGPADPARHKVGAEREAWHIKGDADRLESSKVDVHGQPWMHALPCMPLPVAKRLAPGSVKRRAA